MNRKKLSKLGIPDGAAMKLAIRLVAQAGQKGMKKRDVSKALVSLVADPSSVSSTDHFAPLAQLLSAEPGESSKTATRQPTVPWQQWGTGISRETIRQMENACRLPVAVQGALMPDAHPGYGLPIGGVLAVDEAVIPYAVGSDIGCRMCMTVLDMPAPDLNSRTEELGHAIEKETLFGGSAGFSRRRDHRVFDEDWTSTKLLSSLKDKAWQQLGSSGSGNHFVEFGVLSLIRPDLGLTAGDYVALLSHSGSRGTGNKVAEHYSKLARESHPELPPQMRYLAWLDLESEPGQEYWHAMQLMGKYAQANHESCTSRIAGGLMKAPRRGPHRLKRAKALQTPAGPDVFPLLPGSGCTLG